MNYCQQGSQVYCQLWIGVLGLLSSACSSACGTMYCPATGLDLLQLKLLIYQKNANLSTVVKTSASFISFSFFLY